jgi:hypothetical protein
MPPERELVDGSGVYVTVFTNLEMVTAAAGEASGACHTL